MKKRVRLVEINLERWRAEQGQIEERYLFINVPSFMLYVIDGSDTVMRSKIIVGKPKTPTPVISSVIECFTIYPYWHVPKKIAAEEYLPIIRQDTSFLSKNNFDVLDQKGRILNRDSIPWSEYSKDYFPVSLRQREGSKNALGLIKFHFDNPFAVFLHDTNARNLFNSKVRAFSHGCIRMEDAETLAHYLATGHVGQRSKLVERYLAERRKGIINALQPMPVYIRYFTVEGVDGRLVYYKDIYGKDQRLNALLHPEASGL